MTNPIYSITRPGAERCPITALYQQTDATLEPLVRYEVMNPVQDVVLNETWWFLDRNLSPDWP